MPKSVEPLRNGAAELRRRVEGAAAAVRDDLEPQRIRTKTGLARLIATMDHSMALAVADWLEAEASRVDFAWELGETPAPSSQALRVAALAVADPAD